MLKKLVTLATLLVGVISVQAQVTADVTVNGDFENGLNDWVTFPTATSVFEITTDAFAGTSAGRVFNNDSGAAAIIKQANLAAGFVEPGTPVTIEFYAKGSTASGGVVFAEFFSEIDGGGTSGAEILGGGPLGLTSSYQLFSFNTTTGPDVSGGITLQIAAVTGAVAGSQAEIFIDNVSVVATVPEPSTYAAIAAGLLVIGFVIRRRRS